MAPIEIGRVRQEFKPGLENLIAGVIIGLLLIGGSCAITFFAVKAVFENRGHLAFWVDKGPSPDGSYQASPGDYDTLSLNNGAYTLRDKQGTVYVFQPDGLLSYEQDTNGNRITATYNDGQLAKLTDSDGQSFAFTYNAEGFISQLTDEAGRITTYTYDSTNDELVSVTGPDGTTSYAYDNGSNIETLHALLAITNPDGTHLYFSYDAQGRLIGQQQDGGADAITYAYDVGPGGYRVIDATGASTTVLLNDVGETAQVIDALGRITDFGYDSSYNLVQVIAPTGLTTDYRYDSEGNVTEQVDPLGNTTEMTYDPTFNRLTSLTDARGNTTDYSYDAQANLLAITYPDSTVQQFSYDPLGNVAQTIDQNGDAIGYTYDYRGLVTQEDFADGTQFDYTYDDRGNMLTATDSSGTITMQYDSADRLTMISYPNGLSLQYSYDSGGRRIQMVDQTGFTVNYAYDAAGRLAELTDGSGSLIVIYTYDSAGRLEQKDMGNGTRTVYSYDADGEVLSITNYAPDHVTVNSFDDYTYDGVGNVSTDTNQDGEWSYSYDADGQLIHAVFVPNASDPDGLTAQDLAYAYDPAGNRTSVTANGVTTAYTTNNMNEYTQVGSATYSYDLNGNLVSIDGGGETTNYTYNDLNQLISASTSSVTSTYHFDPLGSMVTQTTNGVTRRFLVDPTGLGNVVSEYDSVGNDIADYTYGLGLTSTSDATGMTRFYDFNVNGSVIGITSTSGSNVNSYAYLPFGETSTSTDIGTNSFTYAGLWGAMNANQGLFEMRNRFYSTQLGRFVQHDPIGALGGINSYEYGSNDPVSKVDPTGLLAQDSQVNGLKKLYQAESQEATEDLKTSVYLLGAAVGVGLVAWGISVAPFVALEAASAIGISSPGIYWAAEYDYFDNLYETSAYLKDMVDCSGIDEYYKGGDFSNDIQTISEYYDSNELIGYLLDSFLEEFDLLDDFFDDLLDFIFGFVVEQRTPGDPNDITGPAGFGPDGYETASQFFPYTIQFQNEPSATAPAQVVTVTEALDSSLDWSTFQLGDFGFGGIEIAMPPGLSSYSTRIDLRSTLGLFVDVTAGLDLSSGIVTWTFTSIDPSTLDLPSNVLSGFLPPDENPPEGEAFINYMVRPKATDATGTVINANATVIFDAGLPDQSSLDTAPIFNTIDTGPPTSRVGPLPPTEASPTFTVTWSGQDDPGGSGIASYDIYDSEDGGPYSLWQSDTTQTSATFTGVVGHTYSFYGVATDNVGNVEPTPATAEATTQIVANSEATTTTAVQSSRTSPNYGDSLNFTATVAPSPTAPGTPIGTVQFLIDGADFGSPIALVSGVATSDPITRLAAGTHTISATYSGDDTFTTSTAAALPLTIAKAQATVTADNKSKVYGAADPTLTYTVTGLLNGDTSSVVSGVTLSSTTGTAATVGTHAITITGGRAANYTITDVPGTLTVTASTTPPPPLVTLIHVQPQSNKKHLVTQILVTLSGPVNAAEAQTLATYRLATAGKKGSFTAKNAQVIKLKSANYNPVANVVTLTPKKPFALTKPVQLLVDGVPPSGLQDSYGRYIDGGKNATAVLQRGGATITAILSTHSDRVQIVDPYAADILLEREDMFALRPVAPAAHARFQMAAR